MFGKLSAEYQLKVLSGDNEGERSLLESILPKGTQMIFNQKPEQKLEFIKALQEQGKNVMMVGDGLNDAGALAQSNVGVSISENVNVFSPACDAILDAKQFQKLHYFLKLSKKSHHDHQNELHFVTFIQCSWIVFCHYRKPLAISCCDYYAVEYHYDSKFCHNNE